MEIENCHSDARAMPPRTSLRYTTSSQGLGGQTKKKKSADRSTTDLTTGLANSHGSLLIYAQPCSSSRTPYTLSSFAA